MLTLARPGRAKPGLHSVGPAATAPPRPRPLAAAACVQPFLQVRVVSKETGGNSSMAACVLGVAETGIISQKE